MHGTFLPSLLFVLLAASWFIFIRFYHAFRSRETVINKRFSGIRRQLQEQNANLLALASQLAEIHEFSTANPHEETRAVLARMAVDSACLVTGAPAGILYFLDRETGKLEVAAQKGVPHPGRGAEDVILGQGVAGRVAEKGKPMLVDDVGTDARFLNEKLAEFHLKSMVALPVKIKDKVIGVLCVHSRHGSGAFGDRALELLTVLSSQCAVTLENLDLYNNLQVFYMEMIETLSRVLEFRDRAPGRQGDAVRGRSRRYAGLIARELSLPDSIVRFVEFAAVIHGVGKIGVSETILKKPGKLTPEEYEEVKRHPRIAGDMMTNVKFLSPLVPILLYHQERWDGSGYPAGLKGEEIPVGSRIVSLINAYEAMASPRPYRPARSEEEIVAEIQRGSGTQFDPNVVRAFLRVLEADKISGADSEKYPEAFGRFRERGRTGDA